MQKTVQSINLKICGTSTASTVTAQQGDTEITLAIRLWDGLTPYIISPTCTAVLSAKKPDNTTLYNTCDIRNNIVYYDFTHETSNCPGIVHAEIRIIGNNSKILTSARFYIQVEQTAFTPKDAAKSKDEQTVLTDLISLASSETKSLTELKMAIQQDLAAGRYDGKSAYQLAAQNGYSGTEEQWLESLRYDHSPEFSKLCEKIHQDSKTAADNAASTSKNAVFVSEQLNLSKSAAEAAKREAESSSESALLSEQYMHSAADSQQCARQYATAAEAASETAQKESIKAHNSAVAAQELLDDGNVSFAKAWSSQKILNTLCLPFIQTGPSVQCNPVEDCPLQITSEFRPIQKALPSFQNIVPLQGWNHIILEQHIGENVFPFTEITAKPGSQVLKQDHFIKSGNYSFSVSCEIPASPRDATISFMDEKGETIISVSFGSLSPKGTFKLGRDCFKILMYTRESTVYHNIMVTLCNPSPRYPSYTPYTGTEFTASFDSSVYGGYLNWQSQQISSPWIFLEFTGADTENWSMEKSTGHNVFTIDTEIPIDHYQGNSDLAPLVCSAAFPGDTATADSRITMAPGSPYIHISADAYDSVDTFRSQLQRSHLQISYRPIRSDAKVITVSGKPVGLNGCNTLSSNLDLITVSGRSDPIYAIQTIHKRISCLENMVTNI